jgi:hypothetical protein
MRTIALVFTILTEFRHASRWSAWRMLGENQELFQIPKHEGGDKPVYFTGEMVSIGIVVYGLKLTECRYFPGCLKTMLNLQG